MYPGCLTDEGAGCLGPDEMNVGSCKMRPSEGVKHIDIFENRLHLYPYQRIICTI